MPDSTQPCELGQDLIRVLRISPDSQTMLSTMADLIGKTLGADVCLIVAGINGNKTIGSAFWNREQVSSLPAQITEQLLSQSFIEDLESTSEPVILSGRQILPKQAKTNWLGEILPTTTLLGIGTDFRFQMNGIILIGYHHAHVWIEEEKTLLKEAAEPVAIASSLIHLQPQLSEIPVSRELTFNLPPLLKIWYEATRQQLEQQRQLNDQLSIQLNQLISSIITTMSDQTRNPLANLRMGIEVLRKKQLSPESLQQRLDILEQEWQKLNDINEKILKFKQLKSQEFSLHPTQFNIADFIKEVIQIFQQQWQEDKRKQLTLEINHLAQSSLAIYTDSEHLRNILFELLTNASKFSLSKTTVALKVIEIVNNETQNVSILVTNEGQCIPENRLKYLFDPFYREQQVIDSAVSGVGLGLTITKELVQLLQGEIVVSSMPKENSQSCLINFQLTIPQFLPQQPL